MSDSSGGQISIDILFYVIFILCMIFSVFRGRIRIVLSRLLHSLLGGSAAQRGGGVTSIHNTIDSGLDSGQLLPLSVTERIAREKQQSLPWTSNLTVSEWLLLKSLKLKPTGMVSGFAHFKLGLSLKDEMAAIASSGQYRGGYSRGNSLSPYSNTSGARYSGFYDCDFSREISRYQDTLKATCQKALDRLQEEARLHGAHAVVGVKVIPRWPSRAEFQIEYIATGTAVVMEGSEPVDKPMLCTTSVIEFAKLIEAGTMPMGIAIGLGVYFNASSYNAQWKSVSWNNQEIKEYANATYAARNIAFRHMQSDASDAGGAGVLGYHTEMHVHELEVEHGENDSRLDHVIEYKCIGTVIGSVEKDKPVIKTVMEMA
jgi:uncharacterized protein YbjQ (UPF0145 family)